MSPAGIDQKNYWEGPGWRKATDEYHADRLQKPGPNGHDTANIAFSDIALAKDFADQNLDLLRFVPLMGKWFVWDGKRWEMDVRLLARECAKETCRKAATQCNKSKMAKLIASSRTISAVERVGQCDQRIVGVAAMASDNHSSRK